MGELRPSVRPSEEGCDADPKPGCVTRGNARAEHLSLGQCEITAAATARQQSVVAPVGNMLKLSSYNGGEREGEFQFNSRLVTRSGGGCGASVNDCPTVAHCLCGFYGVLVVITNVQLGTDH